NKENFPDPEGLFSELREMGFHVVCIVDAGVKVDEEYAVYLEGKKRDLYCKTVKGEDYQNAVWPGVCVFPDFINPQAREWWGDEHRPLVDVGVAGVWCDMNEPALFLPLNSTMPPDVVHHGEVGPRLHMQVHNAYGSLMVQATREGLLRLQPDQRPLVISRAGYAGVQRHALIWTGDNLSTWEHFYTSVAQLQNLGLSGVGWVGVDVGGFYFHSSGELLARWTEFGLFQPFCRNHSEKQTRPQEPWVFGEPYKTICRTMLQFRQRLIPYLYTLFEECHRTGAPLLRPLFWAYPDDEATYALEDEFLCGDALLVAPITRPGAEYRHVYIPQGDWYHYWSGEHVEGPAHVLAYAPLGQPAFYVKANTAIPLWPSMKHVGERAPDPLTFLLYPAEGRGQAALYEDAGDGYEYEHGAYARRTVICEREDGYIHIMIGEQEGSFAPSRLHIHLELREISTEPETVRLGDSRPFWRYDAEARSLLIELDAAPSAFDLSIQL
ncbi:MAG TPA: TIM-barrel domain-containing protein, partial [Ktedonobacteraceae bacterium]|nr:TIM-barrel domain-containing protein [Ktedonobacteraceae bacterium]